MIQKFVIQIGLVLGLGMAIGLSNQPNPTSADMVSATPTAMPTAEGCPARADADESILYVRRDEILPQDSLEHPIALDEFEARTVEFLNAGGDPLRLQDVWRTQGAHLLVREHDLDKNGTAELFITVRLQALEDFGGIGFLYCKAGRYHFAEWLTGGTYEYSPRIITIEDLDHDGKDEAILTQIWSGSACDQSFWVMQWENEEIAWLLGYDSDARFGTRLGCSVNWMVRDIDADGTKEIVLEGYRSPPQSGDYRRITEVYALRGERYALISETPSAPVARVHYMEDGYEALKNSDIAHATELYEIAVFNEDFVIPPYLFSISNLTNADAYPEGRRQVAYLGGQNEWAFSHFRLLTLYYAQGKPEKADFIYQRMEKFFPEEDYGYEYRKAATVFITEWNISQDGQKACKGANELLRDYAKRPSEDSRVPSLSFQNYYFTYASIYIRGNRADWCLIPAGSPSTTNVVPDKSLPPPLPPHRATDSEILACVADSHPDERLLYLDREYIFTLIQEAPPMVPEEFIDTALEFLNSGGTPLHLQDVWRSQGESIEIQERDLDGDGVKELLFSLWFAPWESGGIGLFYCDHQRYHFGGWYPSWGNGGDIVAVEDIDQDGKVEMVLLVTSSGGACKPAIRLIQWQNRTYQERSLVGDGMDCTSGYIRYLIGDQDGDGFKEIYLRGSRSGLAHRYVNYLYTLQEGEYHLVSAIPEAPSQPIHFIEDGNRRINEGNIVEAIIFYEQLLTDESLDWVTPEEIANGLATNDPNDPDEFEKEREKRLIALYHFEQDEQALAMFRLVVLAYVNNDPASAQGMLDELAEVTTTSFATTLHHAAQQFTTTFTATRDLAQACQSAESLLNEQPLGASSEDNRAYLLANYAVNRLATGEGDWCPF